MKHEYYINEAAKIALKSPMYHKHGAIIIYKNKIVSRGYNYYYNHLFSIHAELNAITNLDIKYRNIIHKCIMYVVRVKPDKVVMSKPCPICTPKLEKEGIKTVYYSVHT